MGGGSDARRMPTPAAALDADRESVLARLQTPPHAVSRPPVANRPRAWLDDVTILDMANVIAGPTIAGTLARFGPKIIKLDPLEPTFDPWNTICAACRPIVASTACSQTSETNTARTCSDDSWPRQT